MLPTISVKKGAKYFRITSPNLKTSNPADYVKVVNGEGSRRSRTDSRYSPKSAVAVYLTEDIETCLAEKFFYFQTSVLESLDQLQAFPPGFPPMFTRNFVLWEIKFANDIDNVVDLTIEANQNSANVFPSFLYDPFRDYKHLAQRRSDLESIGHDGLRAPSSRSMRHSPMVVLFRDQSNNVATIEPYDMEFRLITTNGVPFLSHTTHVMYFGAGEVQAISNPAPPGWVTGVWDPIEFRH